MASRQTADSVRHKVLVQAPAARAFSVFTEGLGRWWPREYSWSRRVLDTSLIEPQAGGRCIERSTYGNEFDWGRVQTWEPPRRLVLSWLIGPDRTPEPDPDRASEVEVRFVAEGPSTTTVEIEHRWFSRYEAEAERYREEMEQSWTHILERFAAVVTPTGLGV
jgi:uncharacterized protein YndB with AHSA1/START domain